MYALGIDPALSAPCGLALLDFAGPQPRLLEARSITPRCGGDWQRRADDVLKQIAEYLAGIPQKWSFLLCYELAHIERNPQTALKLADLGGGIRGLALNFDLDVIGVQPTQSKVALTGDAAATKEGMIRAARALFGRELSEHEADAVAHALAGQAAWQRARLVREARG